MKPLFPVRIVLMSSDKHAILPLFISAILIHHVTSYSMESEIFPSVQCYVAVLLLTSLEKYLLNSDKGDIFTLKTKDWVDKDSNKYFFDMGVVLARVLLCILMLVERKLWLTSCSAHCSCYTFHDTNRNRWIESNQDCETRNGTLVSMETEDEWNFITSEIQKINSTANEHNEWLIGLTIARKELEKCNSLEEKRKAGWSWASGQKLTIFSKWQPGEPNNRGGYDQYCVAIAKNHPKGNYGLIKDVNCASTFPYICEYDAATKVNSRLNPVCWSNSSSKIRLTSCSQVIPPTTGKIQAKTTRPIQTTQQNNMQPTTIMITTTMSSQAPVSTMKSKTTTKSPSDTLKQTEKYPSYVFIIIIVLAVLVIILIVIFIAFCCWMRKKKGKSSFEERSSLKTTVVQNNLSSGHSVTKVDESSHTVPDPVIYAEVNEKTAPHPTPAYSNAQEYMEPIDSLPSSPTQTVTYSTIDDSNTQHIARGGSQSKPDETTTTTEGSYEAIPNNGPNPGAIYASMYAVVEKLENRKENEMGDALKTDNKNLQEEAKIQLANDGSAQQNHVVTAVYAVVDKSKKTKGKTTAGDTMATHMNNLQDEEKAQTPNDASALKSPTEVAAMYAVVDKSKKSKKGKKAGVSIATSGTVDQNEVVDHPNKASSSQNPPGLPGIYEPVDDHVE